MHSEALWFAAGCVLGAAAFSFSYRRVMAEARARADFYEGLAGEACAQVRVAWDLERRARRRKGR